MKEEEKVVCYTTTGNEDGFPTQHPLSVTHSKVDSQFADQLFKMSSGPMEEDGAKNEEEEFNTGPLSILECQESYSGPHQLS